MKKQNSLMNIESNLKLMKKLILIGPLLVLNLLIATKSNAQIIILQPSSYINSSGRAIGPITASGTSNFDSICLDSTNKDTCLVRDTANTLGQRNGTNPQIFDIYNTFTDTSNYEKLIIGADSTNSQFGILGTSLGTGVARGLRIGTLNNAPLIFRLNGTDAWQINSSGNFLDNSTHTLTVGSTISGSNYIATSTITGVANVAANSCGTTSATILGSNNSFVITVGATSGSQCRVQFSLASTTAWDCVANDDTTTIAVRTTPVDTTHTDIIGSFTAADKITGHCWPR